MVIGTQTGRAGQPANRTLLVIGYVWPEPDSSAAGAHMLSLLRLFKRAQWQVVFSTPAQKTDHMIDLALDDIASVEIQLNDSSFDTFVDQLQPEMVLFDRFMMEEQFGWRVEKMCPDALRVLDTEDLQCLRHARHHAHKQQRPMTQTDLLSDLAKREIAAILRSDLSLIISDFEMDLLQKTFNLDSALLHHLPFMPDQNQTINLSKNFHQRSHFVTIGNFRHAPNWDSVLYLKQIWPQIRQQLPDAELHIYGSYPPKKATELNHAASGFLVKGWAQDAFEVIANARICLAPLRFGAGIKGKFLDAMRVGTPSVTTSIGAEGMAAEAAWPGLIANDEDSIVQAAVSLYQHEALWQSCQSKIAPLLRDKFDTESHSAQLLSKIADLQQNLNQHRLDNFVGAMLNHHSMKSTQYMSKWIELKNRLNKNE